MTPGTYSCAPTIFTSSLYERRSLGKRHCIRENSPRTVCSRLATAVHNIEVMSTTDTAAKVSNNLQRIAVKTEMGKELIFKTELRNSFTIAHSSAVNDSRKLKAKQESISTTALLYLNKKSKLEQRRVAIYLQRKRSLTSETFSTHPNHRQSNCEGSQGRDPEAVPTVGRIPSCRICKLIYFHRQKEVTKMIIQNKTRAAE